jgi:uncharacterized protein
MRHARPTVLGLGVLMASALGAGASPLPPRPERYATDRAGVFTAARLEALNERLAAFERETSNQVIVYVDRRLPPGASLETMATTALRTWGVGRKGRDNGVVFFVFVDDRLMRVEVGYGLERTLTNAVAKRITGENVKPFFKRGDYAGGVEAGVNGILAATRGTARGRSGAEAAVRPRPAPAAAAPSAPAQISLFAGFWNLAGRTLAIGAGVAALLVLLLGFVARRSPLEDPVFFGRGFMTAWGVGTAATAGLRGELLFGAIAFVAGLLCLVDWRVFVPEDSGSGRSDSTGSYDDASSSDSSSSGFSGGGGDGGGGGASDGW